MSRLFHPLPSGDNGAALTAILAEDGVQAVLLVPGARYVLQSAIVLRDGQTLATDGYPSVVSGQQALLETRGEGEAVAVNMFNRSDVTLACVHINGCRGWGRHMPKDDEEKQSMRREGKLGWLEGGGSLVWCGGPESRRARVEGCRLEDPRGWTALHVVDWAQNAQIKNNVVGPCGQEAPAGPWADGLSIAGKDTLVEGNTIIDATDGAIVVFCAPGSQIVGNTIIARGRDLLGGINLSVTSHSLAQTDDTASTSSRTRTTTAGPASQGTRFARKGRTSASGSESVRAAGHQATWARTSVELCSTTLSALVRSATELGSREREISRCRGTRSIPRRRS